MADSHNSPGDILDAASTGDQQSASIDSATARGDVDGDDEEDNSPQVQHQNRRKRPRGDFPWAYTHDWVSGDPQRVRNKRQCVLCKKWFSSSTNAQGWKVHLKNQHHVTSLASVMLADDEDGTTSSRQTTQLHQAIKNRPLPPHVPARKIENAIVDYVVGGGISLRAAGEQPFQKLITTLTDGYTPPSTRTILRRTVELFNIAQPLLAQFLYSLDVCVSLSIDGWSNVNLKGFHLVTAHWVDTASGQIKSVLLTILDVSSGTDVGNRVGSELFKYLNEMVGPAFLSKLLHVVTDNSSDACAAVNCLFQRVNSHLGSKFLLPSNHVFCADHSVQCGAISILAQVKEINEKLRGALARIRRSKVMRQSFRLEAERLGYASKGPPHLDNPTRWISTYQMCSDALQKREALDQTMIQHEDDLGRGPLSDLEWAKIGGVVAFLQVPRQVMETLAGNGKSSLDLVQLSIAHLTKHCDTNVEQLKVGDDSLSVINMKTRLVLYEEKIVQLPAIVAGYLNPQVPKPSDQGKLEGLKGIIRTLLKEQYADKMECAPTCTAESDRTLFNCFFPDSRTALREDSEEGVSIHLRDEVDQYLALGIVHANTFIDAIQWWTSWKDMLPAHYQMAMDYLGTPATSTSCEGVDRLAGHEFTTARQSLSSELFVKTMCLRSWMGAQIIKLPEDRQVVKPMLLNHSYSPGSVSTMTCAASIDGAVSMMEVEQEDWVEEVLDDGIVGILNIRFDTLVSDELPHLSCL